MQAKNDGSDTVGDLQKRVNELRFEANKIQGSDFTFSHFNLHLIIFNDIKYFIKGGRGGRRGGYSTFRGVPRGFAPRARGRGFNPRGGRGRGRGYFAQGRIILIYDVLIGLC